MTCVCANCFNGTDPDANGFGSGWNSRTKCHRLAKYEYMVTQTIYTDSKDQPILFYNP